VVVKVPVLDTETAIVDLTAPQATSRWGRWRIKQRMIQSTSSQPLKQQSTIKSTTEAAVNHKVADASVNQQSTSSQLAVNLQMMVIVLVLENEAAGGTLTGTLKV
jgi:hypothetical protein